MNTSFTGYTGSEMGMSEAEIDYRNMSVLASQSTADKLPSTCCTEYVYRGSEMGMSEAVLDALHHNANVIRIQNIAKVKVNGICKNCPSKNEKERVAQLCCDMDRYCLSLNIQQFYTNS